MEEFKEIPGLPGYFVSSVGRVRKGLTKFLSLHKTKKGYVNVQILADGKRNGFLVHRLVASAFIGDILGMEVDHLNFDKEDNRVENLEIVTRKENMQRFHANGNTKEAYKNISEAQKTRWSNIERPPVKTNVSEAFLSGIETRGGSRPGSGAPKKPPGEKRVKVAITMRPDLHEATKGNRSGLIEDALDLWIQKENEAQRKSASLRKLIGD